MSATRILFLFFILLFACTTNAQSLPDSIPLRILVIRHGEKPDSGLNLDCQGWNRALALPAAIVSQFGVPHAIYVPEMKSGKKTKSVRMYQTVIPLAIKYQVPVNTEFEETDSTKISAELKSKKGLYLVVWDKKNIPALVHNLGIDYTGLHWPDKDYDSIWIIDYCRMATGEIIPRIRKGKEGLMPSKNCN